MPKPPTRDRLDPLESSPRPLRRPDWIKVRAPGGESYAQIQTLMRKKVLAHRLRRSRLPKYG